MSLGASDAQLGASGRYSPLAMHFIGIQICNFKFPSLGVSGFALGASGAEPWASGPGLGASGPAASPLERDVMKNRICNLMHLQIICKPYANPRNCVFIAYAQRF